MEEPGESLNRPILPYPGKQLLTGSKDAFFGLKSQLKDRYIYDLGLSTGEILYESAGGMGICTEKHIFHLHDLLRMPYAESLIHEEFEKHFKGTWGPRKFYRLRRDVNQELKNPSRRSIAKLYCLLACSGFRHKFDTHGNFKGEYFPHSLDTAGINLYNKKLINSDFILKLNKTNSIDTKLLTKQSLVYINLPFPTTKLFKECLFAYFDYLSETGFDFLFSARFENRGLVDLQVEAWAGNYNTITIPQFKEDSLFYSSDIFIFNF